MRRHNSLLAMVILFVVSLLACHHEEPSTQCLCPLCLQWVNNGDLILVEDVLISTQEIPVLVSYQADDGSIQVMENVYVCIIIETVPICICKNCYDQLRTEEEVYPLPYNLPYESTPGAKKDVKQKIGPLDYDESALLRF